MYKVGQQRRTTDNVSSLPPCKGAGGKLATPIRNPYTVQQGKSSPGAHRIKEKEADQETLGAVTWRQISGECGQPQ